MGSSKAQTVGYKYYMPLHFVSALSRGPTADGIDVRDCLFEVRVGDRTAWSGAVYDNATISVDAPDLFGGDEKEGGIVGTLQVMFGAPDQPVNARLAALQGDPQSAHRGLFSLVWEGQVCSNNPYLKPWAFARRRITGGWHGECWYPETAAIPLDSDVVASPSSWAITYEFEGAQGSFKASTGGLVWPTTGETPDLGGGVEWRPSTRATMAADGANVLLSTVAPGSGSPYAAFRHSDGSFSEPSLAYSFNAASGDALWNGAAWMLGMAGPRSMVSSDGDVFTAFPGATGDSSLDFLGYALTAAADKVYGYGPFGTTGWLFSANLDGSSQARLSDPPSGTVLSDAEMASDGATVMVAGYQGFGPYQVKAIKLVAGVSSEVATDMPSFASQPNVRTHFGLGRWWVTASDRVAHSDSIDALELDPHVFPFVVNGIDDDGRRLLVAGQNGKIEAWTASGGWVEVESHVSGDILDVVAIRPVVTPTADRYCMNPAHIVYQCLTDPNCLGYPTAVIDDASFAAAADQLYAEGLGLNLKWTNQETIENFIGIVCDHAGMLLVRDRRTGLYKLRLLRDDYDIEDLRVFTPSNSRILAAQRPSPADIVNELQVTYTDYKTFKEATVPVRDPAAILAMGRVVSKSHSLTGLPTEALANRCGARDLAAMTSPLWRIDMAFLRDADDLEPGEPFLLDYPASEIFPDGLYLVLRIADEINYGNAAAGQITAKCVQDVFSMPVVGPTGSLPDVDPIDVTPLEAVATLIEVPYRDLVQTLPAYDLSILPDDAGYLGAVAARPNEVHHNFDLYTSLPPADLALAGTGDFAPSALLAADIGPTDTVLAIESATDLEDLDIGSAVAIGEGADAETVRVDAIAGDGTSITVGRGCGDTVPRAWPAGTRIWGYDEYAAGDRTQYIDGETVEGKVLTRTAVAVLAAAEADTLSLTFNQRAARPYPPGLLRITDDLATDVAYPPEAFGALTVTWAHRDRLLQQDQLIDEGEASIGPEAGTTYTVRFYLDDVLDHNEAGISGTSATPYALSGDGVAMVEVEAVRDGLASWQALTAEFQYYTSLYYTRIDDAGDVRTTDAGDPRISE